MTSIRPLLIAFPALLFCIGVYGQDSEIQQISAKLTTNLTSEGRKSVAVVDFTDLSGCVTELGRYVAEELSTDLASQHTSFQVVDRTSLQVIMQENKLASTGVIDPTVARRLGQIAGVDTLISGTLTPLGDTVHLSVKALDATTARVIIADRGDIPRTGAVNDLLARGVGCSGSLPATGTRAQAPSQATPNAPPATSSVRPITERNYRFDLQSCKEKQGEVVCRLLVTNQGDDRKLWIEASTSYQGFKREDSESQLFDNLGNGYIAKSVRIANDHGEEGAAWHEFPNGVPTPLQLSFDGVAPDASSIGLLQILCTEYGSGGFQIRIPFRGIPIDK